MFKLPLSFKKKYFFLIQNMNNIKFYFFLPPLHCSLFAVPRQLPWGSFYLIPHTQGCLSVTNCVCCQSKNDWIDAQARILSMISPLKFSGNTEIQYPKTSEKKIKWSLFILYLIDDMMPRSGDLSLDLRNESFPPKKFKNLLLGVVHVYPKTIHLNLNNRQNQAHKERCPDLCL